MNICATTGSMMVLQKFGFTHAMTHDRLGPIQHGDRLGTGAMWCDVARLERCSEKAGQ